MFSYGQTPRPETKYRVGDIAKVRDDLSITTLYFSRDGVVCMLCPKDSEKYRGCRVKIRAVEGRRYALARETSLGWQSLMGWWVDEMLTDWFEPYDQPAKSETETPHRDFAFAKKVVEDFQHAASQSGVSLKDLEQKIEKYVKDAKRSMYYDRIRELAQYVRCANTMVDDGLDPTAVFETIQHLAEDTVCDIKSVKSEVKSGKQDSQIFIYCLLSALCGAAGVILLKSVITFFHILLSPW